MKMRLKNRSHRGNVLLLTIAAVTVVMAMSLSALYLARCAGDIAQLSELSRGRDMTLTELGSEFALSPTAFLGNYGATGVWEDTFDYTVIFSRSQSGESVEEDEDLWYALNVSRDGAPELSVICVARGDTGVLETKFWHTGSYDIPELSLSEPARADVAALYDTLGVSDNGDGTVTLLEQTPEGGDPFWTQRVTRWESEFSALAAEELPRRFSSVPQGLDKEEYAVILSALREWLGQAVQTAGNQRLLPDDWAFVSAMKESDSGKLGDYARAAAEELTEEATREAALRLGVVSGAYSLVGKVNYFWGGKYNRLGWNPGWGTPQIVSSPKSKVESGTIRPLGLDCTGFVSWAFVQVLGESDFSYGLESNSVRLGRLGLDWSDALPGDLVYTSDYSHVGIVSVNDSGLLTIIHCTSEPWNSVMINDDCTGEPGSSFRFVYRPDAYEAGFDPMRDS